MLGVVEISVIEMRGSTAIIVLAFAVVNQFLAVQGRAPPFAPIDGGWSEWEPFGQCDKSCGGGHKRQYRYCNNPWPANGGRECPGPNVNIVSCNTHSCPVNGGWSPWGTFGACSQTCGVGHRIRSRQCTEPEPTNGGEPCFGPSSDTKVCNAHACPDEPNSEIITATDGNRYQLVRCFNNDYHRLQKLIITERDHTHHAWNGYWIDWGNWNTYMAAFANRCAVKTAAHGYKVFGLSYYGECWSDSGVYDALAVYTDDLKNSSKCVTNAYKNCKVGDMRCIGKHYGIAVYQIIDW